MIEMENMGGLPFHMFKSRRMAAVVMAFLVLCGVALTVGAGTLPNSGAVSFLAVVFPILGLVILIRAWRHGGRRGTVFVPSSKVWKPLLFLAFVLASGAYTTYAVYAFAPAQAVGIGGLLLLLTANLVFMLLFEVDRDRKSTNT